MKLGEAVYKAETENNDETTDTNDENNNAADGDVFDADFEDLTDEKKQ